MNLSRNFTLAELTQSQTAARQGIDNTPGPAVLACLVRTAALLEQVRALVGGPVAVSSGYRSAALNRAVGGAANSAHVLGLAADITVPGISPRSLALLIRESGIEFDQLIVEGTWVHIGLALGELRRDILTAHFNGGHVTYSKGIQ